MLIIASTSTNRLARWKQGLHGMDAILEVGELSLLKTSLASYTPELLFIDLNFPGLGGPSAIRKLRQASPLTKIVVLGQPASEDDEIALFSAGVRGCCSSEVEPETLQRVVVAVRQGEPWIRRALVPRLLDELSARVPTDAVAPACDSRRLAELTRREQQIAALIRNGDSNKQIARRLEITERTVKAHLTDIFRKLGIDDRLKLALMMSGGAEV